MAQFTIVRNDPVPSSPDSHWLWRSDAGTRVPKDGFLDQSEYGILDEVRLIEQFLREGGHETSVVAVDVVSDLILFLQQHRPDAIFNCCESFRGRAAGEMSVAGVFELAGIPYTGSPALTLGIALNKAIAKALFQAHGVPTARFSVCDGSGPVRPPAGTEGPWIVKPVAEDASIGIDAASVVHDATALRRRVRFVLEEFRQPAIIEEFIDGREFNVALLAGPDGALKTLPVSEIVFRESLNGSPRIVSYEAKWIPSSEAYLSTPPQCPATIAPGLAGKIRSIALRAAAAVGLRDYGRVDIRVRSGDDEIFVLEANPNPDISADSGMVVAAGVSGLSHGDMIRSIANRALERR